MRNGLHKSCREIQNTNFIIYLFYFLFLFYLFYIYIYLLLIYRLRDNVEKYGRVRQVTDGNVIGRILFA